MKKVLLLVVLILTTVSGYSQDKKIKIDAHAGGNFSRLLGSVVPQSPVHEERYGLAFLGGVGFEKELSAKLSAKVEVNYERKRQSSDETMSVSQSIISTPVVYEFIIHQDMDYITIPLFVKYFVTDKKTFYINGGAFLGYLVSAKSMTKNLPVIPNLSDGKNELDIKNAYNSFDFGAIIAIGKNFSISGKQKYFAELKYNHGLQKINKSVFAGSIKTSSLNFVLGYRFN